MDVKKEGPVDVVASHLSKVGLVPAETPKRVIMKKLLHQDLHIRYQKQSCVIYVDRKVLLTTHEGAPLSYRGV